MRLEIEISGNTHLLYTVLVVLDRDRPTLLTFLSTDFVNLDSASHKSQYHNLKRDPKAVQIAHKPGAGQFLRSEEAIVFVAIMSISHLKTGLVGL